MVSNRIQSEEKIPKAVGHYSQVVKHGDLLFTSGQIAINPATGQLVGKTVEEQTKQILSNLRHILENEGTSLKKVLKVTVFITNITEFEKFNRVYSKAFGNHKPARTTVEVANLPKNALIEIDCISYS